MKRTIAICCLAIPLLMNAQNVGINQTGAAPDPSAMLDISSDNSGLLTPRMTTAQKNGIATPATGLIVYDTDTDSFWYYDGTQWLELRTGNDTDWVQAPDKIYNETDTVAIGLDNPKTNVHISGGKNFLIGDSLSGQGFKMIYYGQKGAFRCGYLNAPFGGYGYNRFWDYDSVGYYSWAGGQNAQAKGFGSFAFGSFAFGTGSGSVAFFGRALGNQSVSFYGNSKARYTFTHKGTADEEGGVAMFGYAGGRYSVSIGGGTTGLGASSAREDYSIALGWNSDARGQASIALGPSDAYGYNSFSTGWVTEARGNYSSTFGYQTNSYPTGSMALGRFNVVQGDSSLWISTDPVFQIGDGTSNSNRSNCFTILKNGQTAVGYNYPTGMLHVSTALGSLGTTVNTADASILVGSTTTGMAFDANQIEAIGDELHLNYGSPENIRMVEGGGNVGIGDTDPGAKLVVRSEGTASTQHIVAVLESNTSNRPTLQFDEGTGNAINGGMSIEYYGVGSSNELRFNAVGGAPVMTVESTDQQVGIGTVAPGDKLQIDAAAGENALRARVDGTTRLRVHANGGVSVGANVLPPAAGLYVNGESEFDGIVRPDNDAAYSLGTNGFRWTNIHAINGLIQTSDREMKKNIRDLDLGLNEVLAMRPVRFEWKDMQLVGEQLGLIAQEVEKIVPESVERSEEGPLGMNYTELVPVLINAIQEQQDQIEVLNKRISELEGRTSE